MYSAVAQAGFFAVFTELVRIATNTLHGKPTQPPGHVVTSSFPFHEPFGIRRSCHVASAAATLHQLLQGPETNT
jgi:hypothetical protein